MKKNQKLAYKEGMGYEWGILANLTIKNAVQRRHVTLVGPSVVDFSNCGDVHLTVDLTAGGDECRSRRERQAEYFEEARYDEHTYG